MSYGIVLVEGDNNMAEKKNNKKSVFPVAAGVIGAAATLAAVALTKKSNRQKVERFVQGIKKQSVALKKKGIEAFDTAIDRADTLRKDMEAAAKNIKQGDLPSKKSTKKPVKNTKK